MTSKISFVNPTHYKVVKKLIYFFDLRGFEKVHI